MLNVQCSGSHLLIVYCPWIMRSKYSKIEMDFVTISKSFSTIPNSIRAVNVLQRNNKQMENSPIWSNNKLNALCGARRIRLETYFSSNCLVLYFLFSCLVFSSSIICTHCSFSKKMFLFFSLFCSKANVICIFETWHTVTVTIASTCQQTFSFLFFCIFVFSFPWQTSQIPYSNSNSKHFVIKTSEAFSAVILLFFLVLFVSFRLRLQIT